MTQPKKVSDTPAPTKTKRRTLPRPAAEIAPEESAERFLNILRDVPSVAVQGYEMDGLTTYWNPASEKLYGYTAQEAIGRNLLDLIIPPEMKQGVRDAIRQMAESGQAIPAAELLLMRKDGSRVPVFSSHAIVQIPGRAAELFCLDVDLTVHKQIEAALKESEERYRLLFDSSLDAIFLSAPDGRIFAANPAACRFLDRTEAEIRGLGRDGLVDPSDGRLATAIAERKRTGTFKGELNFLGKDGTKIPGEVSTAIFRDKNGDERTSIIVRDITGRKQSEEVLRASEVRHRNSIEFAVDGILHGDSDGKIIGANSQMQKLAGRTLEELLGLSFSDLFSPEELRARPPRFDLLNQGGIVVSARNLLRPGGTTIPVEMHSKKMPDGTYQSIYRDITQRKRVEVALKESEERYQRITQAVTDYIYTVRVADGRAVETTHGPGCQAVTGYGSDEFFHDSFLWLRMVIEDDRPIVEEQARRILTGEDPPPIEHRIKHKSGAVRWVRNTFVPHRNEQGMLIAYDGLIQDITARKQAEEALRESETSLKEAQTIAGLGSYLLDISSGKWRSSEILNLMFGLDPSHEHTVEDWESMIHPEDRALMAEYFKSQVLGHRQNFNKEYRILRRDNQEKRWVHGIGQLEFDANGQPVTMRGTIQDITKRKQAEKAIAALALRNQTILQTASDGIHVIDEKGNVVEANLAFCRMLGYTREELLQLNVADWDAQWPRENLIVKVGELITQPAVFETKHRRKDGSIRDVEINSTGVVLEGRRYLYASARDITERKQAVADKERLAAQNQQLQKTESLGRMAGAVAHHFNNQLQSVMMRLEMAMNDLPRNIEPVASLTEAMISARKAAEVSTQMLTYLGQSFDRKEPLDLAGVCAQYLPLIRAVMPRTISFTADLPSPGPTINASANQIHQLLTNLLTNAWEASAENRGSIELSVKAVAVDAIPKPNRFPVDCQPHETTYACLSVVDSGCGIAAKDFEKLFDPFFSSKFTGRGLGLSVVLGITRSHRGLCTVESELGKGSVFRIFLPVIAAAPALPGDSAPELANVLPPP